MSQSEMITNQFGEQYLYAVNRGMFEQESAKDRIEREFGDLLAREDSLIIFIGSDSGNIIRYLVREGRAAGSKFIFVEPEELYHKVVLDVDLEPFQGTIYLTTPDKIGETVHEAAITNYLYVDSVFMRRSLSALYGFYSQYRSDYWDIESEINDLRWNTIVSLGQDAFIQRQLQNCADNLNPLSEIKGCLEGKTVIVLGGGPSLDEHLDWIQRHRKKLVVFAVSRISARLQQVKLEPDFVFSVDPHDISYQVSKDMLKFGAGVIFVNQYHVAPKLLSQWPYRKFYMGKILPWHSDLNPENNFKGVGPTVTNSAISAAAWLGSTRILLSGVDLCFTPEGYTHARGSRERASGPRTDLSSLSLLTNAGDVASTTPDFASAARTIGLQAKTLKESGVDIINLSSAAARMDNVIHQTAKELKFDTQGFDLDVFVPDHFDTSSRLLYLREELESRIADVESMESTLVDAVDLHNHMYMDDHVDPKLKRQLEALDATLAGDYPDLLRLIKTLAVRGLLRMSQSFQDVSELELEQIRTKLNNYYDSLVAGAQYLLRYLNNGLASVNMRLREKTLTNAGESEIDAVSQRWIERSEPGRAFFVELGALNERYAAPAREAYQVEMHYDHLAELTQQNRNKNYLALPSRIQYLTDKHELISLEALYNALEGDAEAMPYLPLVKASVYKMRDKKESALLELLPVMDQPDSPILEQVLAMMVGLCAELGHHQAVLDAMAGLASLNASYLSFYADALAANGQVGDAIEHLTEYLHYFPTDTQAIKKLRHWYSQQGNKEGVVLTQSLLESLKKERENS